MKHVIYFYIFILTLVSQPSFGQINDQIKINKQDFKSEKVNNYDKIGWVSDYTTNEVGKPQLPVCRVSYVLPVDVIVTGVNFKVKGKQKTDKPYFVLPYQQPIPTGASILLEATDPDKMVYSSDSPYPNKLYDIESDEFYMGYHIVTLRIYPFEYIPKSRVLNYYSNLEYTIEYAVGTKAGEIKPLTQNLRRAEHCKILVKSLVRNTEDVDKFGSNVQSITDGKVVIQNKTMSKIGTRQKVKPLSVMDEIVPDYIIVTNNALKPAFQALADWKTKKGVFTIIKTTEEITTDYSGSDIQEKIRNYLIEAYSKYGPSLYVLLGGGVDVVPARMVSGAPDGYGNEKILYPTDMYYATYLGTWNANNNNLFREDSDNLNYSTGVILGRIPVGTLTEATNYINKVISYEKAANIPDLNYFKNNLYSDAYMAPNSPTPSTQLVVYNLSDIKSIV